MAFIFNFDLLSDSYIQMGAYAPNGSGVFPTTTVKFLSHAAFGPEDRGRTHLPSFIQLFGFRVGAGSNRGLG
jgi:hypothetical protein